MLIKLLKYEWKSSYKIILLMNIFIIITTLVGILTLIAQIWNTASESISSLGALLFVFYFLSIALISVVASIYIAVRFYRSMYTDEGYLVHTLPVTKNQLLLSKTIIGTIHIVLTTIVVLASIFVLFYFLSTQLSPTAKAAMQFELSTSDLAELTDAFTTNTILKIILIVIYFIASSFHGVLLCFSGISLGQLFTKHKVISSIICYIGLYTILQMLSSFITLPFTGLTLLSDISLSTLLDVGLTIEFIFTIFCNIAFYGLSYYILNKKLNLD